MNDILQNPGKAGQFTSRGMHFVTVNDSESEAGESYVFRMTVHNMNVFLVAKICTMLINFGDENTDAD